MTNWNEISHNSGQAGSLHSPEFFRTDVFHEAILWKLLLLTAMAYLVWSDKISIVFGSMAADDTEQSTGQKVQAGIFNFSIDGPKKDKSGTEVQIKMPPGSLNNVTFAIDPEFGTRNDLPAAECAKRLNLCRDYIARFSAVAIAEMRRSGVPASITLAQGLLESNASESRLAQKINNHFGMKCFSTHCEKGHCVNFKQNSHKDFFVKYANAWGSYQAHTDYLKNSGRYIHLFELDRSNYRAWARGLAKAGYNTSDEAYGEKLIAIIQILDLDRFDKR